MRKLALIVIAIALVFAATLNKINNIKDDQPMEEAEIVNTLLKRNDIEAIINFNDYKIRKGRYEYLKLKHGSIDCDEKLLKELIKNDLLTKYSLTENIIIEDDIITYTKEMLKEELTDDYKQTFAISNGYRTFSDFLRSKEIDNIITNQHLEKRYASFQMKQLKTKYIDKSDREIFSIYKKEFNDTINAIYLQRLSSSS